MKALQKAVFINYILIKERHLNMLQWEVIYGGHADCIWKITMLSFASVAINYE